MWISSHGWGRASVCVLTAILILTCACATTTKRLSEDLANNGFSIAIGDQDAESTLSVAVTDVESTDRLLEWFRHRPHGDFQFEAKLKQSLVSPWPRFPALNVNVETGRFRLSLMKFPPLVVLDTRASLTDEWQKTSWDMRDEDFELREWLLARFLTEFKLRLIDTKNLSDEQLKELDDRLSLTKEM